MLRVGKTPASVVGPRTGRTPDRFVGVITRRRIGSAVSRETRAWEYLFGGLTFAGSGLAMVFGSAVAYPLQVPPPGMGLLAVEVAFGGLVFCIGAYWLWKFDQARRREAGQRLDLSRRS